MSSVDLVGMSGDIGDGSAAVAASNEEVHSDPGAAIAPLLLVVDVASGILSVSASIIASGVDSVTTSMTDPVIDVDISAMSLVITGPGVATPAWAINPGASPDVISVSNAESVDASMLSSDSLADLQ